MTKTVGLIGGGMIGSVVARLAVAAGLDVVLSNSRGPETLADLVADLGPRARAATPDDAARAGDVVVAAVPMHAHDKLPVAALAGKTVIDTTNYYHRRDGRIAALDSGECTSSALVQRHLPDSAVVKACNNLFFLSLLTAARPSGSPERSAMPIAGDDPDAKAVVTGLLDTLGYDTVDTGPLAESWSSEPGTPVYVLPYFPGPPPWGASLGYLHRWFAETPQAGVSVDRVKDLIDRAIRLPAGQSMI